MLKVADGKVHLRRVDGKVIAVALERISQADRDFLGEILADESAEPAPFVIDGVLSIATPEGFVWKQAAEFEEGGVPMRVLLCSREGSTTVATLMVEHRSAVSDAARTAAIKGHYNALVGMLQNGGFKDLKGARPAATAPVADVVSYSATGEKPDDSPAEIRCATIFGKNVYSFTVIASDAAEADRMFGIAKTLQEK